MKKAKQERTRRVGSARPQGRLTEVWKNNLFLLKICFKTSPKLTIAFIAEKIRNEICIFLEFTIGLNFVLSAAEFGRPFREVALFFGCLLAFVALGLWYGSWVYQKLQMKMMPQIKQTLKTKLYSKAKEIDLSCYDDPEFYNDYILAISESDNQVDRMFEFLNKTFTGIIALILSLGYFMATDVISMIFVLVSFVGTFLVSKVISKLNYKIRTEKNPHERKLDYTNRVFYLNDYAKEIRLNTEVGGELLKDFDKTNDEIFAIDKKNAPKRMALDFLKNYVFSDFIIQVLFISYLVYNALVLRRITFSSVAVMFGLAGRLRNRMMLVSELYPYALETSLFVDKILKFLETEPKIISKENRSVPKSPSEIELQNVSFGYSDKDGYILKNINMKINPYSKIAIVGYNGAGKTTLIKLIMRLYDPCEGEILLDGVNIKEYNIEDYRRKIGTVFQDFKIFAAAVKENVVLDCSDDLSNDSVISALEKSGFADRLKTLPNGLETNLTTEFEEDGVNLSGGEGQKLAIARVFYSQANLIILDEPSSALDPIAEYHINRSMLTASENKTVLFISHRLSTTRIADRIYMLENGEIIEEGEHNELLEHNGKYAEMWKVQAGQYNA